MAIHLTASMQADRARELSEAYRTHRGAIAYLDETFSLDRTRTQFYAMTASVMTWDRVQGCRSALLDAYDGEPMHASELFKNAQSASLDIAVKTVSVQQVKHCVVVQTEIAADDPHGDVARQACLGEVFRVLSAGRSKVTLYVADSRGSLPADRVDLDEVRRLRSEGKIPRDVTMLHRMPSEEPLIALADVTGWTWRQHWLGTSQRHHFAALEARTHVQHLKALPTRADGSSG